MIEIDLQNLKMNHFTTPDAELYCKILNINPNNVKQLDLYRNNLKDINGINIFKNLELLCLRTNDIKDLSPLKNLVNLKRLDISNLNLIDELNTVNILKSLHYLNELQCYNTFKTVKIKKELKKKGLKIYD